MTTTEVLQELEKLGTEQTRKTYRRHGAGDDVYGVKFGDLGKLKKKIGVDHEMAQELWATGNYDARNLATMIADPARTTGKMLNAWVKDLTNYSLTDVLAAFVAATPHARKLAETWMDSGREWTGRMGWLVLARLSNGDELPDEYFEPYLETIEREIHTRKNRVRDAMNSALIAIGIRGGALTEEALAVAARIGKVEVDHGDTACRTPEAGPYILKALEHRRKKKSR